MPGQRVSLLIAGALMAVIVLAFDDAVGKIAMPALGGLLTLIGFRTLRPADLASVWKTGTAQRIVLVTTFALTMLIAIQYAVLAGVALSVALYVIGQSNKVTIKRRVLEEDGDVETFPPELLPSNEVVLLQPYGSLFFAAAPLFEAALPAVSCDVKERGGDLAAPGAHRRRLDVHCGAPALREPIG